jgi:hypothetical protein
MQWLGTSWMPQPSVVNLGHSSGGWLLDARNGGLACMQLLPMRGHRFV